jgi:peptide deformylase
MAFSEKDDSEKGIRQVFVNPEMILEDGPFWDFEEGCLSIPQIRENVSRKPRIKIRFYDKDLVQQEQEFEGLTARVIQHEYDHIEGKLFIDYLSPLKKQLIKSKLNKISKGDVNVHYRMKFPKRR